MNTDFVINMSSKSDYFDSDRVLSKWGFTDSQCHNCGISNSEINGLLMQCGKCKKAYYCGMKCFNEHLPQHQLYCGTKEMFSQPTGKGIEIECKRKPIGATPEKGDDESKCPPEDPTPKRKTPKKKKSKSKKGKGDKSKKESTDSTGEKEMSLDDLTEQFKDLGQSKWDSNLGESQEDVELELEELTDIATDLSKLETSPPNHSSVSKMNHSFAEFGRDSKNRRMLPLGGSFSKEEVDLRQTEMFKREYSWMTPDWINKQLRKTPKGRKLLENGDLSQPVTDIRMLLEEGLITWEKPAWANPNLRPTQRGQQIKDEALELENSFREEFGHKSFS